MFPDRLVGVNTWAIFMLGGGHFAGAVFKDNQVKIKLLSKDASPLPPPPL